MWRHQDFGTIAFDFAYIEPQIKAEACPHLESLTSIFSQHLILVANGHQQEESTTLTTVADQPICLQRSAKMVSFKTVIRVLAVMEVMAGGFLRVSALPTAEVAAAHQNHYEAQTPYGRRALQTDGCQTIPITVQATMRNKRQSDLVSGYACSTYVDQPY